MYSIQVHFWPAKNILCEYWLPKYIARDASDAISQSTVTQAIRLL